jgi:hypothetical protein
VPRRSRARPLQVRRVCAIFSSGMTSVPLASEMRGPPRFGGAFHRRFDQCGACQSRSLHVGRERYHQNRIEESRERLALPDDDGSPAGLFALTIRAKVGPPDLASSQPRSSRSRADSQASSPDSASVCSSEEPPARRFRSHRAGSGRRTTTIPTCSPGRSASRRSGRSTPSSNVASMRSMSTRIAP